MNGKTARHIASLIPRQSYIENLEQLQLVCLKLDLDIDFDCIYFNAIESLEIAAIYGLSINEENLFILTKNKQLHFISISNREHSIIDLNKSVFRIKIKLILNKIRILFNH